MDLGISGRWAIVCAASKGLGLACARALAKEGVNLVINARGNDTLQAAANELRALAPNIEVRTVAGDISTPAVREQVLDADRQIVVRREQSDGARHDPMPVVIGVARKRDVELVLQPDEALHRVGR